MWKCIAFLDKDLMADAPARRVKVYPMYSRESLDRRVLLEVLFGLILYVMVQGEDNLFGVVYTIRSDRLEPVLIMAGN